MSQKGPVLTDLMVRYPWVHYSRSFFDSIPIEESFSSAEVMGQAEMRLMNALGRASYEPRMTELMEFSSFFVSAFVASQDGSLASRFARKEAERSREFFRGERPQDKVSVMGECFSIRLEYESGEDSRYSYSAGFENYLSHVSRYELTRLEKWKLVRQPLSAGRVYFADNTLEDLFGDSAQRAIAEGLRNLRRAPLPKQLLPLKAKVLVYVPAPRVKSSKSYGYIEELLRHPVSDGRHRATWLILAPFATNVKNLPEEEAVELIRNYTSAAGETGGMRRFIEYNVRRAKRLGLMPPTLEKLKTEHPDLYALLPDEVLRARVEEPKSARKKN